jgi:hypothetical protein
VSCLLRPIAADSVLVYGGTCQVSHKSQSLGLVREGMWDQQMSLGRLRDHRVTLVIRL